ncbi:MAG: RNA-binding S4 domain-containing protein [Lachnospiraceae bacterium]|nr:RNA-binding S4 domain-containing protein [Lachnospiraceae bacterium]
MEELTIREGEEYIKLGQALKAAGLVGSGAVAKEVILEELVKVNGTICTQRGKKLYNEDIVEFQGEQIKIKK